MRSAVPSQEFRFLPLFWFLGMDDKPAQRVYFNLELARVRCVALKEKEIAFIEAQ